MKEYICLKVLTKLNIQELRAYQSSMVNVQKQVNDKVVSEIEQKEKIYQEALCLQLNKKYEAAIVGFEQLGNYKNSESLKIFCEKKLEEEEIRKEKKYCEALRLEKEGNYEAGLIGYEQLGNYKDSLNRYLDCKSRIENRIKSEEERKEKIYREAVRLKSGENYEAAIEGFRQLGDYKRSIAMKQFCENEVRERNERKEKIYNEAIRLEKEGNHEAALIGYEQIKGYKDSINRIQECHKIVENKKEETIKRNDKIYSEALRLENEGKYEEAKVGYEMIPLYNDSRNRAEVCGKKAVEKKSSKQFRDKILKRKKNKK